MKKTMADRMRELADSVPPPLWPGVDGVPGRMVPPAPKTLAPCDHDECGITRCRREGGQSTEGETAAVIRRGADGKPEAFANFAEWSDWRRQWLGSRVGVVFLAAWLDRRPKYGPEFVVWANGRHVVVGVVADGEGWFVAQCWPGGVDLLVADQRNAFSVAGCWLGEERKGGAA